MNYQIADFMIRVKNAYAAHRTIVVAPYANLTKAVADLLVKERMLASVKEDEVDGKRSLTITLRYTKRKPTINDVRVISKPSLRVHMNKQQIVSNAQRDAVLSIVSTSQGVMTAKQANAKGIGGELLFKIW